MPRYQGGGAMMIQGKACDMNALKNPFDDFANINDDTQDPNKEPDVD
jgi:hypothetical protein